MLHCHIKNKQIKYAYMTKKIKLMKHNVIHVIEHYNKNKIQL